MAAEHADRSPGVLPQGDEFVDHTARSDMDTMVQPGLRMDRG